MSATTAAGLELARLDRLTNAIRRGIESVLPWYDPDEAVTRRQETERVRRRSMAARIHVEDIARRYQRQDGAIRRW